MTLRAALAAVAIALAAIVPATAAATASPCPDAATTPAETGPAPGEVTVRFMGVSTLLFSDGRTHLLIDGFLSRPTPGRQARGPVSPDPVEIDWALGKAQAPAKLTAVLVAHAHIDHAFDAPVIAARRNALLVGSASVGRIAKAHQLPASQFCEVKGGEILRFGAFTVRPIPTGHGKPELFKGEVSEDFKLPARTWDYRSGQGLAFVLEHGGRKILIHPSGGSPLTPYRDLDAEVVFLGVAFLGRTFEHAFARYWNEVVAASGAKVVVPVHWDSFTSSLRNGLNYPRVIDDPQAAIRRLRQRGQEQTPPVAVRMPGLFESAPVFSAPAGP